MIKAFPKIFTIGQRYIIDIFKTPVEITEKIDGSQFVFGKINGELFYRSKGAQLFQESPQKMFLEGMNYIDSIQDCIPENKVFYCEYLQKPRHNILAYDRTPINHLIIFGASDETFTTFDPFYYEWAKEFNIEAVPIIEESVLIKSPEQLLEYLNMTSVLGGQPIEGVVVKNYNQTLLIGDQPIAIASGKYVAERFKEKHDKNWKKENTGKGQWELYKQRFRSEARWEKAIIHLREKDEIEDSPRDIGKLIKEIQKDVIEEEKENIKEFLWKKFGNEIPRYATAGFPEWYKEKLLKDSFNTIPKEDEE